ncbi:MAG: hypothetical protein ACRDUY_11950 [Nitriliruptorales bacterium]
MTSHLRIVVASAAAGILVGLVAAAAIPVSASRAPVSGDEPFYLITAISLWEDGSLDVADEYDDPEYPEYRRSRPQGRVLPDGRIVEPHDPLLPALLAAPAGLGGAAGAKAALAVLAGALAALLVWIAVRRLDVGVATAVVAVVGLGGTLPLVAYGSQLYPELPAALATTVGVAALLSPGRRAWFAGIVIAVVALPWLSVKYVPVAGVLAVLGLLRARREGRGARALVAVLGVACVAYVAAHLAWYGGLTVYATGRFFAEHGGEASVLGTAPNYPGRTIRLIGLLVDRDVGLAAWQPAWLLGVPAIVAFLRRDALRAPVLAPLVVGWLGATFLAATMHGWWFPGRQVVVVLPLAVLAVAAWANASRTRRAALLALVSLGAFTTAWFLVAGRQGEATWIYPFSIGDPWRGIWTAALPAYQRLAAADLARHAAWLLAILLLALQGWRSASGRGLSAPGARPGAGTRPGPTPSARPSPSARPGPSPGARPGPSPGARPGAGAAVELTDIGAVVAAARAEREGGRSGSDEREDPRAGPDT